MGKSEPSLTSKTKCVCSDYRQIAFFPEWSKPEFFEELTSAVVLAQELSLLRYFILPCKS